jgi:glucokinase
MEPSYYFGVDIGATRIKIGLVTAGGALVAKEEIATHEVSSPAQFLALSRRVFEHLLKKNNFVKGRVKAIGVGAPGWVNYSAGIVNDLTNMPGWQSVPLAEELERENGIPAFVDNDANVMAIGEMVYGAGKGFQNFICLTLGTGVGGALIINGDLYRGMSGLAGEVGHMTIDMNGRQCACGARGCLERYVGNRFIIENAVERLRGKSAAANSIILKLVDNQLERITPKLLSQAAADGDEIALEVWRETGNYLGIALACLVNLLNPECFIVGGGVANAGRFLFEPMRRTMEALAMNEVGKSTPIFQDKLREDAGVIGAGAFGMIYSKTIR